MTSFTALWASPAGLEATQVKEPETKTKQINFLLP